MLGRRRMGRAVFPIVGIAYGTLPGIHGPKGEMIAAGGLKGQVAPLGLEPTTYGLLDLSVDSQGDPNVRRHLSSDGPRLLILRCKGAPVSVIFLVVSQSRCRQRVKTGPVAVSNCDSLLSPVLFEGAGKSSV